MAWHSVAEEVQRALEARLLDGTRLPAERVLAETLGVSRNSLREAVFCLKACGLLVSRPGSGVFVTDCLQAAISSPWQQLLTDHPDLRWDRWDLGRHLPGPARDGPAGHARHIDFTRSELTRREG